VHGTPPPSVVLRHPENSLEVADAPLFTMPQPLWAHGKARFFQDKSRTWDAIFT
jgi:hypothetical protein